VAEFNGKVVGMIGLCSGYSYVKNVAVRIIAFVVHSKYQNKGIEIVLIQEAKSWAKKQGGLVIETAVNVKNEKKPIVSTHVEVLKEKGSAFTSPFKLVYLSVTMLTGRRVQ
jgi:GNAT superfamily N-acetyltransferase